MAIRATVAVVTAALAFFLSHPAIAQQAGSSCNTLNKVYSPWYLGHNDNSTYICDGSILQTLSTATASPLQLGFLGNVGIGTTAPGATLNIVGNTSATNLFQANASATYGSGSLSINQYGTMIFYGGNVEGYDSNVSTGALSTFSGTLYLTTDSSGSGNDNIVLKPHGTGNVGIGATSPSFPLSLGTGLGNKIGLYDAGSGNGYGLGIQTGLLQIFAVNSGSAVGIGYGNSGAFTSTLTVLGSNVGIGTSSPADALDIGSKTDAMTLPSGTTGQRPTAANGMIRYNSSTPGIEAYYNSAWNTLGTSGGATLNGISAATAPQGGIANGNNTIVWNWDALTNGAAMKFATNGINAANGQSMLQLNLSGASYNANVTSYGVNIQNTHTGSLSNNVGVYATASGGTNNYAAIFDQGNVGIGVTNPGNKLEVNGNTYVSSGNIYLDLTHAIFLDAAGSSAIVEPVTNNIAWTTNSTERMRIDANGKVGIGTTSPNTTLDVAGYIETIGQSRVSSDFTQTSNATLSAITGLSATLTAGKTYAFEILLYTTESAGGVQVDLNGGTATATSIVGECLLFDNKGINAETRIAALNTNLCNSLFPTSGYIQINGTITVNAGGTFIPEFAQSTSSGSSSVVKAGSRMILQQIN